jgi:hypothetical protein
MEMVFDGLNCSGRWGSKTFEPSAAPSSRRGGFEDRERGGSGSRDLEDAGGISRADTEDRWSRRSPPAGPPLLPFSLQIWASLSYNDHNKNTEVRCCCCHSISFIFGASSIHLPRTLASAYGTVCSC